jgi:ribosomal protein L37AE/L43A
MRSALVPPVFFAALISLMVFAINFKQNPFVCFLPHSEVLQYYTGRTLALIYYKARIPRYRRDQNSFFAFEFIPLLPVKKKKKKKKSMNRPSISGRRNQSFPAPGSNLFSSNPNSSVPVSSSVIDAAALQNEMNKKYGISNMLTAKSSSSGLKQKRVSKERKLLEAAAETCPSCSHQIVADPEKGVNLEYCEFCGYFLNTKRSEPTLAQKRGLVPMNEKEFDTLKPLDWYLVERNIQKKVEPDAFCPICMGPFVQNEEVLLSCGHIFHKVCLRSFENFVKNGDITCPLCRYTESGTFFNCQVFLFSFY